MIGLDLGSFTWVESELRGSYTLNFFCFLRRRLLRHSAIGDEAPQLERFYMVPLSLSFGQKFFIFIDSNNYLNHFIFAIYLELELELVYFIVKNPNFTLLIYHLLSPLWRNVIGLIL